MNILTQTFLILGVSKSGFSAGKYILNRGGKCYFYEELNGQKIDKSISELTALGGIFVGENTEEIIKNIDVLVISPGVPINHQLAIRAKKEGKRIVGELEFAFLQFMPNTIAITGTNGKTTTVNMIGSIFDVAKVKNKLVGNIGVPVSSTIDEIDRDTSLITEVSSFQLESVNAFCPHIACILNISPDHLERHYSMENYIFLKKRLLLNLTKSEYAVLNFDDEVVKGFALETKANIVWVSLNEKIDGAYFSNGSLFYNEKYIISEEELPVKGKHNVYNALFAIAVGILSGLTVEVIKKGLIEFKGARHRLEFVCEKDKIKYVNDSKSTNTASTITAIESVSNSTILILGGSEKGEKYNNLFEKIKLHGIKHVVLTGTSRFNMLSSATEVGYSNITLTDDFITAIKISRIMADEGDTVLLSPACASFDRFNGYEERGDEFIRVIRELF